MYISLLWVSVVSLFWVSFAGLLCCTYVSFVMYICLFCGSLSLVSFAGLLCCTYVFFVMYICLFCGSLSLVSFAGRFCGSHCVSPVMYVYLSWNVRIPFWWVSFAGLFCVSFVGVLWCTYVSCMMYICLFCGPLLRVSSADLFWKFLLCVSRDERMSLLWWTYVLISSVFRGSFLRVSLMGLCLFWIGLFCGLLFGGRASFAKETDKIVSLQQKPLSRRGILGEVGGWGRDPKNCTGRDWGWGRIPFNETYAPSLSTIYDGA